MQVHRHTTGAPVKKGEVPWQEVPGLPFAPANTCKAKQEVKCMEITSFSYLSQFLAMILQSNVHLTICGDVIDSCTFPSTYTPCIISKLILH
jgi:hypothetical protein